MSEEFSVALSNPEQVGSFLYSMRCGDTASFLSGVAPVDTNVVNSVLIRIRVSTKPSQHGFVTRPGSLRVTIPDEATPQMRVCYAAALRALYRVAGDDAFPWIFTIGRGSDETHLVITTDGWKFMSHTECAEENYRPRCPERNMVHKLTMEEREMECPIKKLPQVTALSGPHNTNKTKLAIWLAKNIGKSKHILLIDPTQSAGRYPGVSVWSDGHITQKKLTAMLALYANDGHGWTVIIDGMADLDLSVPSDTEGLYRAIEVQAICVTLRRMAKSLPIKFILVSHEDVRYTDAVKADYDLTDIWIRTTTAQDNTVAFTVSSEKDGPSEPFTQVLP